MCKSNAIGDDKSRRFKCPVCKEGFNLDVCLVIKLIKTNYFFYLGFKRKEHLRRHQTKRGGKPYDKNWCINVNRFDTKNLKRGTERVSPSSPQPKYEIDLSQSKQDDSVDRTVPDVLQSKQGDLVDRTVPDVNKIIRSMVLVAAKI